ncbi:MAG TPA: lytic transglycosylase domain-containing protein [Stellaceae bacterium]|nr:lytic transglycosylase domain-containing protein [Stellaceae bacterium]
MGWRIPGWLRLVPCFLVVLLVAGCATHYRGGGSSAYYAPTHYYPPPGPPGDPWGPYIREAAARYTVPEQWIRAVMKQESGGQEQAVSPVGAMGLMQLMPRTYRELEAQNGLGADPFNPRDNILAGTAYIREMYNRFGSPGFLAAYNAGPRRLDSYLAGETGLPMETVHYVAAISPNLGTEVPMSGPLANYAGANIQVASNAPTPVSFATGCDVNAAYDPNHPCTSAMANEIAAVEQTSTSGCDLNAAYNPGNPCTSSAPAPARQAVARYPTASGCDLNAAYNPYGPCTPAAAPNVAIAAAPPPAPIMTASISPSGMVSSGSMISDGSWAIQVGAFSTQGLARTVAEGALAQLPAMVRGAAIELPPTTPFGGRILYRARLTHLSQEAASNACAALKARQLPCIVVPAAAA